jgi:hypothetical protein
MPATAEQPPPVDVDEPKHPLAQPTTYELNAYLRQLHAAVTFFEQTRAPALTLMRDKLARALSEQADRKRLAGA